MTSIINMQVTCTAGKRIKIVQSNGPDIYLESSDKGFDINFLSGSLVITEEDIPAVPSEIEDDTDRHLP